MPKNSGRKNTNRGRSASPVFNKPLTKKPNTTQTTDSKLIVETPQIPTTPVLEQETSTMEVDPVEETSTKSLDKGKSLETVLPKSTTPKLTTSVDESFDASENILDTSTIGFETP